MTAINAFLKRDRAILMTDGSMYTPEGLIMGCGQKAVAMPTLKAAVAVRGAQKVAALLAMEMSVTFTSMDHVVDGAERYFPVILDMLREGLPDTVQSVQLVVVGWSDEQNRPIGFSYDTMNDDEPFEMIDGWVMSPLPDEEEDRNLNLLGCELERNLETRDLDPIRHGIPIMEAQRRMKVTLNDLPGCEPISIVGGNILLTEVTRDGVQQRVVHRWNDIAGENIEPEPFRRPDERRAALAPMPFPAGASRAERRRLEKLQRQHVSA